MTYDDDTFAMQFDDAVNNMHAKRTEALGSNVWRQIEAQLPRADAADPRVSGRDLGAMSGQTSRRERTTKMDATLATPLGMSRSRGLSAWLAAGLALLLAVSGFYLSMMNGDKGGQQNLAWAPGPGTPISELGLASPAASPPVYTYGPEYACTVEPLTADETLQIALNPLPAYMARGESIHLDMGTPTYYEETPADRDNWTSVAMSGVVDPELSQSLSDLGNNFWSCLMSGTAYQVWAMMDPALLQWSILRNFPVIRSEEEIQEFIETWGPQRYGTSGLDVYPIITSVPVERAARVADTQYGSIRVSKPRGLEGEQTRIGVITMIPKFGDDKLNYYEIYVSEHPDGTWSINEIGINPNKARG